MTSGRVCVVGSFMMDLIVRAPCRPAAGETIVGTSFSTFLGGKGFNQAVAAARAGARTSMVGRVGDDDYGRRFKSHLTQEGIDHEFVIVDPLEGTGIGLPLVEDSGENSIVIIPRCNMTMTVDDVRAAKAVIEASDVLLLQFELPMEAVCEAARLAHGAGTKVVLNPAPAPPPGTDVSGLHGFIDLLVPNVTEAAQLAGADTTADPADLAARLRDRFGCDVLITLGSHGALVLDDSGILLAPTYSVPVLDTVGAGDAFCGTLGTWMANGASLREAVVYANAAGALAVGKEGAEPAMPHRAKVLELVNAPVGWCLTVAEILGRPLRERPDQEAVVDDRRRYTYRELDIAVRDAAAGLTRLGLRQGDPLAVSLPNGADVVIAYLAAMRLGLVFVGVHPALTGIEVAWLLGDCDAAVMLGTANGVAQLRGHDVRADLVALDVDGIDALAVPGAGVAMPVVDPHAVAAIAYTSGTTGRPKGVIHDQHHMLLAPSVILHHRLGGRGERVGVHLPLTTLNMLILGPVLAFIGGGTLVCTSTRDAGELAELVVRERIDSLSSSPAIVHDLVEHSDLDGVDLKGLRLGIGGATCPERLRAAYRERFGRDFTTGYGLSEAPTAVSQETERVPHRVGASGVAMAHVELFVVDADHQPVPAGEEGHIAIGPATAGAWAGQWSGMLGYHGLPEATAAARHGALLLTGDQGRLDADGYLYVADRHSELINRGGSKVSPAEVERALRDHPSVADCIVLGRADDRLGEQVVAAVETRPGAAAVTAAELQAHCRTMLAAYKVPALIAVVDRLARSPMGKIVRDDARRVIERTA